MLSLEMFFVLCRITGSIGCSLSKVVIKNTNKLDECAVIYVVVAAVAVHSSFVVLYQLLDELSSVLLQHIVADVWDVVQHGLVFNLETHSFGFSISK